MLKIKMLLLSFGLVTTLLLGGCVKDPWIDYTGGNHVFFGVDGVMNDTLKRNVKANFGYRAESIKLLTANISIGIIGDGAAFDRPLTIEVDEELSTAVVGRDYNPAPLDTLKIAANRFSTTLRLQVFRTEAIYQDTVELVLRLKPNAYFGTDYTLRERPDQSEKSSSIYRLKLSDAVLKPTKWDENLKALGAFSREKLLLLTQVNQITLSEANLEALTSATLINGARVLQTYLNEQRSAGKPILERNGKPMQMGPDALKD